LAIPLDIDARKFVRVARQRLDEAKTIHAKLQLWSAAEYLGGYAVECALKALILIETPISERPASGSMTIEWLKREFGHDLHSLRIALARRGAQMPRAVADEFLFVSTWNPQLRYEPEPGDPEKSERFLLAAGQVLRWADQRM
jgi:hypothetical protein